MNQRDAMDRARREIVGLADASWPDTRENLEGEGLSESDIEKISLAFGTLLERIAAPRRRRPIKKRDA